MLMTKGEEEIKAGKERETKEKETKKAVVASSSGLHNYHRKRKGNAQHSVFVERNELADVILLIKRDVFSIFFIRNIIENIIIIFSA